MTSKRLRTRTKIFFPNPHVVRLDYEDASIIEAEAAFRKIIRSAYRLIEGTWGYSELRYEFVGMKAGDFSPTIVFNGISHSSFNETTHMPRGYLCFENELDALQFRLSISTKAFHVKLWPACWFTIHEVVETDEP